MRPLRLPLPLSLAPTQRRDEEVRDTMMRVEARVDQGQLRLRDEVGLADEGVRGSLGSIPDWGPEESGS